MSEFYFHDMSMAAPHVTHGSSSEAMDWWLLDSGASTHLISEETLQHVQVLSLSEHVGRDCVTATGASIGVQKSAVVRVCFAVERSSPIVVEFEALVAPVRFNLLSLGRLLNRNWTVSFAPHLHVQAGGFKLKAVWSNNCCWLQSHAVARACLVSQEQSAAQQIADPSSARPSAAREDGLLQRERSGMAHGRERQREAGPESRCDSSGLNLGGRRGLRGEHPVGHSYVHGDRGRDPPGARGDRVPGGVEAGRDRDRRTRQGPPAEAHAKEAQGEEDAPEAPREENAKGSELFIDKEDPREAGASFRSRAAVVDVVECKFKSSEEAEAQGEPHDVSCKVRFESLSQGEEGPRETDAGGAPQGAFFAVPGPQGPLHCDDHLRDHQGESKPPSPPRKEANSPGYPERLPTPPRVLPPRNPTSPRASASRAPATPPKTSPLPPPPTNPGTPTSSGWSVVTDRKR